LPALSLNVTFIDAALELGLDRFLDALPGQDGRQALIGLSVDKGAVGQVQEFADLQVEEGFLRHLAVIVGFEIVDVHGQLRSVGT